MYKAVLSNGVILEDDTFKSVYRHAMLNLRIEVGPAGYDDYNSGVAMFYNRDGWFIGSIFVSSISIGINSLKNIENDNGLYIRRV